MGIRVNEESRLLLFQLRLRAPVLTSVAADPGRLFGSNDADSFSNPLILRRSVPVLGSLETRPPRQTTRGARNTRLTLALLYQDQLGFDPLTSAARHRLRRRASPECCARTVLPTRPERHPVFKLQMRVHLERNIYNHLILRTESLNWKPNGSPVLNLLVDSKNAK